MEEKNNKVLIEKMGWDKYNWAWNIQGKPLPFWTEAFDYAYQLGLKRGYDKAQSEVSLSQKNADVIPIKKSIWQRIKNILKNEQDLAKKYLEKIIKENSGPSDR